MKGFYRKKLKLLNDCLPYNKEIKKKTIIDQNKNKNKNKSPHIKLLDTNKIENLFSSYNNYNSSINLSKISSLSLTPSSHINDTSPRIKFNSPSPRQIKCTFMKCNGLNVNDNIFLDCKDKCIKCYDKIMLDVPKKIYEVNIKKRSSYSNKLRFHLNSAHSRNEKKNKLMISFDKFFNQNKVVSFEAKLNEMVATQYKEFSKYKNQTPNIEFYKNNNIRETRNNLLQYNYRLKERDNNLYALLFNKQCEKIKLENSRHLLSAVNVVSSRSPKKL